MANQQILPPPTKTYAVAILNRMQQGLLPYHEALRLLAHAPPHILDSLFRNLNRQVRCNLRMVMAIEEVMPYEISIDFGEWNDKFVCKYDGFGICEDGLVSPGNVKGFPGRRETTGGEMRSKRRYEVRVEEAEMIKRRKTV